MFYCLNQTIKRRQEDETHQCTYVYAGWAVNLLKRPATSIGYSNSKCKHINETISKQSCRPPQIILNWAFYLVQVNLWRVNLEQLKIHQCFSARSVCIQWNNKEFNSSQLQSHRLKYWHGVVHAPASGSVHLFHRGLWDEIHVGGPQKRNAPQRAVCVHI